MYKWQTLSRYDLRDDFRKTLNFNDNQPIYVNIFMSKTTASSFALIAFAATLMTSTGQVNYARPPNNGAFEYRFAPPAPQPLYNNNINTNGLTASNAHPSSQQNNPSNIYFPSDSPTYTQNTNQQQPGRQAPLPQNPAYEYQPQTVVMVDPGNYGNSPLGAGIDDRVVVNSALPTMPFAEHDYQPVESITDFSWNIFKVSLRLAILYFCVLRNKTDVYTYYKLVHSYVYNFFFNFINIESQT